MTVCKLCKSSSILTLTLIKYVHNFKIMQLSHCNGSPNRDKAALFSCFIYLDLHDYHTYCVNGSPKSVQKYVDTYC